MSLAVLLYIESENWQASGLPGQVDFPAGQVAFHCHLAKAQAAHLPAKERTENWSDGQAGIQVVFKS